MAAACLAQLADVIAQITTEPGGPARRQTTFHPFALTARHGRGEVLTVRVDSPTYTPPPSAARTASLPLDVALPGWS